jgi:hypothetical protein
VVRRLKELPGLTCRLDTFDPVRRSSFIQRGLPPVRLRGFAGENVPKSSSKYKRLSDHRLLMLGTNRQGDVTRVRIGLCLRGTFVGLPRTSRIGAGRRQLCISPSQTSPFPAQVPDGRAVAREVYSAG